MAAFEEKIQALMDEFYSEWQNEENKGKSKWDVLDGFSEAHQIAVVFGNFNYQVGNGGISQWIYNGYFHDDSEKLTKYLEIGAESDERCRTILDRINLLDQCANETDCDRDGNYYDDDGDNRFIGDMMDCDMFDTWYYANCDDENWWQVVSGIIDKVEGRESTFDRQEEHDSEAVAAVHSPISVYIENVHDDRIGGFTMPLPTTLDKLQPFLEGAEINGWQDAEILEVYSDIEGLGESLTEVIHKTMTPDTLDELNYLAVRIQSLQEGNGQDIFAAAIETKRYNVGVAEIINLTFTENLNCFDLMPAFSNEQYGDFLIEQVGVDAHAEAFSRLEDSDEPSDNELAKYIEKLEKYVDRKSYGRDAIKEENGALTENGLLLGGDGMESLYHGQQDIPAEYRIFTKPGEIYKSPMKLDGVDIATTIMKLHAVCGGGEIFFAEEGLRTLIKSQAQDYLMSVNRGEIFLSQATDVYKRGTEESAAFSLLSKTAEEGSDIRVFAVRVMSRDENNVIGDMVELNGKALHSNLSRHGVAPDRIDAVFSNGAEKSYDVWAWAELPTYAKDDIREYEQHYPTGELSDAAIHFSSFLKANEMSCEAVSMDTFLPAMNAAYMAAAENPQANMLRISNDAAKEILAGQSVDVYRLTSYGVEKLAPIEAAKPMLFADNRDLAIKREDIAGLDKWAKRTTDKIIRQNERGERNKAKNKGEEL